MEILVEKAIELACLLQQDQRYLAVREAQKNADADADLQQLIGDFNLKRIAINAEETKEDAEKDVEKLRQLNQELRDVYAKIMANEHMMAYNDAKTALDGVVGKINAAIALAVNGQDPHMAAQEGSCTGNCGTCGGCH